MRSRKHGQIDENLVHIMTIAYLIYVVVITTAIFFIYTEKKIQIEDAELQIISNRLINEISKVEKDTGRLQVGNIEVSKDVDREIDFGNRTVISASIRYGEHEMYYNQKWFVRMRPRVGFDAHKNEKETYLIEEGRGKPGKIEAIE
ncbi:hypothetical protein HYU11_01505 [Candidatus Woesearchaeota archaeon]|nr:hypothetical protein [Candidatus Woesearchaeota archaeon]